LELRPGGVVKVDARLAKHYAVMSFGDAATMGTFKQNAILRKMKARKYKLNWTVDKNSMHINELSLLCEIVILTGT